MQHTAITRYAGEYPSLSAFALTPAPAVADTEQIRFSAEAEIDRQAETDVEIHFKEPDSGVPVTLTYESDALRIRRGFTDMLFCPGKETAFLHHTGVGELSVTAFTEQIRRTCRDGKILLVLVYRMYTGGMVQKNEIRFRIG